MGSLRAFGAPATASIRLEWELSSRLSDRIGSVRDSRSQVTVPPGRLGAETLSPAINDPNGLACLTSLDGLKEPIVLRPLPGFPVIRDLIVDMTQFFAHYHSIKPWLMNDGLLPERERLRSPAGRERQDGLYEFRLCAR